MEIKVQRDNETKNNRKSSLLWNDDRTIIGIVPKSEKSIGSAIKGGFEKQRMF